LFYVFVLFVAVCFCVVRGRVFLFGDDASQTEQLKRNLCFHSNSVCCVFKVLQMLYAFFPFVFTNNSNEIFVSTPILFVVFLRVPDIISSLALEHRIR
jgi:hypothetical protein